MKWHVRTFIITSATLLLCAWVEPALRPFTFSPAIAAAQTAAERTAAANRLYRQARQHQEADRLPEALETFHQALAIFRELGDRQSVGETLNQIGIISARLGQYAEALQFYQQGLDIAHDIGDRNLEGTILHNLAFVYQSRGQYAEALQFYQQALDIAREMNDRSSITSQLNNIGLVHYYRGQYPEALQFYREALRIAREINDREGVGAVLDNLGVVYGSRGEYERALASFEGALEIRREMGDRRGIGTTLNNIALIYYSRGQYAEALQFYKDALDLAREIGDRVSAIRRLNNIGGVYDSLGQYPEAVQFYREGLEMGREIGDRPAVGYLLNNLGATYGKQGQYPEELQSYRQALAISREIGDRALSGTTLNNIGTAYLHLQQSEKALDFYRQGLEIAREIGNQVGVGKSLNNLGKVYATLGETETALDFYRQGLEILRGIGDGAGIGHILNNMGRLYREVGEYQQAEEYLFAAIEELEKLRPGLTDKELISLFETQLESYELLQSVLVKREKFNRGLEVAERGRARAFITLLAKRRSPNWQEFESVEMPTVAQIQTVAREQNATIVEYAIVEEAIYIWTIAPTGEISFHSVTLTDTSLATIAEGARVEAAIGRGSRVETSLSWLVRGTRDRLLDFNVAAQETRSNPVPSVSDRYPRLQQLHSLLIEPIAHLLPADPQQRIILIPHQSLFLVPFSALQDSSGRFLIEKHTLIAAPSIQVLALTHQQRERVSGDNILVVGNPTMPTMPTVVGQPPEPLSPLPHAEREAMEIARLFHTTALTGNQATKARVLAELPEARIVHLATHGVLDDFGTDVPGAIALAPSESDRGWLMAGEIVDLPFNAELVVLSACNTGRGKITGDGAIGLSRALMSAGVPSIIVSLWSVPDAPTATLMSEFYRHLQHHPDKAQALRQAMLTTMKTHPNPRNWAGFLLMGEAL
ncbi:CHAT domain-containing protein [Phormidium sp. CCY1219]|uniref:CHAT domain-containing protein n=1 Tax=Phormidium sp. CCY1219 TaxID=2886104 RepID=UPI002D1F874B|nr:CHAT domain-containing tetratricopeptide repeat protein [Phormidium sp. CCY1219]MEB3831783.1 CHAT domain-containing tetratricopeptide repeat protein [Phormidium sp. CCY1219]